MGKRTLLFLLLLFGFYFFSSSSVDAEWREVILPYVNYDSPTLRAVHFTSANEGWAVGDDYDLSSSNIKGVLLHYSSGIWTPVIPPNVSSDWRINAVHFTSANEGWAVGYDSINSNGVLLH
jgi:hypothetical protein